jgi:hypothetical protein
MAKLGKYMTHKSQPILQWFWRNVIAFYSVLQKKYILLQKKYVLLQKEFGILLLQKKYILLQKEYVFVAEKIPP